MEKETIRLLVLIDPGHGADEYTDGKCSALVTGMGIEGDATVYNCRFREGNFNRIVAHKLAERVNVELPGVKAEVVVTERIDIRLSERVRRVNEYCKRYGSERVLLLSVHSNTASDDNHWKSARGWLSIVDDCGSEKSKRFADMLFDSVKTLGYKTRQAVPDRKWYYYRECIGKPSRLSILSKTMCPAVLTENFFYTDPEEVKFLASEAGREEIVRYHFDAIKLYANKYFS